jgi:HSP20 family protein
MFRAPVNYRDYQVVESDDAIDVRMDVPGATRQDLDVTVKNGYLTVKSERQDVTDGSRASKSFSFKVGSGYEAEDLEASLENGVLTVSLPKEKKQEIKVEIR